MATLAAYDPEHGIHPWSWMKTCLSDHYRGLTVTHQESGRALARVQSRPEATIGQIPRVELASVASISALKHPNSVAREGTARCPSKLGQSRMQRTQTDACRTAAFWRRALSHLPCRQTSTGWTPPPVRAANNSNC